MRITILGLPASGKSTLAREIAKKAGVPHIQLDRFWLEAGGKQNSFNTPNIEDVRAHVVEKTMNAISAEEWVSDGFYSQVQTAIADRADIVIFLDVPLWKRLFNYTTRVFRRKHAHPELSLWDDIKFTIEVVKRTFTKGPRHRRFIKNYKDKLVVLRTRKDMASFVANLKK